MPVYVVRVNDGTCLIGEADSEATARESFLERWGQLAANNEFILSVREVPPNRFLSRWWPSEDPEDDVILPGILEGTVDGDCDVYENEYQLIEEAHRMGAKLRASASSDESIMDRDIALRTALRNAVRAEMRRGSFKRGSGSIQ